RRRTPPGPRPKPAAPPPPGAAAPLPEAAAAPIPERAPAPLPKRAAALLRDLTAPLSRPSWNYQDTPLARRNHLEHIRDREADLGRHHHQVHVPPGRMVLGLGEGGGVADEEVDGVDAPGGEQDAEDGQQGGIAGEDRMRRVARVAQAGAQGEQEPGEDEERADDPGGPADAVHDWQRPAAAGAVAGDV